MATPEQQAANQANAQLSTGPKTEIGKARASLNARSHGLCAKDILIGPEEKPEFDKMTVCYYVEFDPQGQTEQTLFDEIVAASWNLRRIHRMEAEACAGHATYTEILNNEPLQKNLERLARHRTRFERTFHRCQKELKAVQAQRRKEDAQFQCVEAYIAKQISERTQSSPVLPSTSPVPDVYDEPYNDEPGSGLAYAAERILSKLGNTPAQPLASV